MSRLAFLLCVGPIALTGCHHGPQPVIQTGPDTYLVGATSHSGLASDAHVTGVAMERANVFCKRQGRVAQMIGSQSSGAQGFTSQNSQVHFKCLAAAPSPASSPN